MCAYKHMVELHPDERAAHLGRLRDGVAMLQRLLASPDQSPGLVPALLGRYVWSVVWAALPLCGEVLHGEWVRWLARHFRQDAGLCGSCGRRKGHQSDVMCATCEEECREIDLELLLDQADERRVQ